MAPATEHIVAWIERHASPLGAWIIQALLWLASGTSPLAALGAIAAGNTAYLRYKKVTSQR